MKEDVILKRGNFYEIYTQAWRKIISNLEKKIKNKHQWKKKLMKNLWKIKNFLGLKFKQIQLTKDKKTKPENLYYFTSTSYEGCTLGYKKGNWKMNLKVKKFNFYY